MSKVYQCDKCGRIFEPRVLNYGEPYITCKDSSVNIDLCPECYGYLMKFLKEDIDEYKCSTCKFRVCKPREYPCTECRNAWDDMYKEDSNVNKT